MKKKHLEVIVVPIVFTILIAWFFRDALFKGQMFVERDLSRYYYPLRFFAINCVKSGVFPFWNPYLFCGNPLFASLQSCVLYPLSVIYYIGDFAKAFNVFIAAHFFLAGLFTYLFMRQMRYSATAAFLSGAVFALSGYMTSVVNLLTTLSAVTWFPLAMLAYYKMTSSAAKISGRPAHNRPFAAAYTCAIFLGIIFTVMFLGGEPSILYMTILLFFCGSAYFTIEEWIENRLTRHCEGTKCPKQSPCCEEIASSLPLVAPRNDGFNFTYLKGMLLAIVVFLGLSAVQFLPFAEFLKISSREKAPFEMASIWNLPLHDTPAIIWPFFHDIYKLFINYWARQSWLDNYYVGILPFIFFVSAVLFDKSKKARAILILGLIGFVISLGKDSYVYIFLYKFMPAFKAMRYSIRFFFIPTFAICVLAGIGIDHYLKAVKSEGNFRKFAFIIFVIAFLFSAAFMALNLYEPYFSGLAKAFAAKFAYKMPGMPKVYADEIFSLAALPKFIEVSLLNLKRAFLLTAFFGLLFYLGTKKRVRPQIFIAPALLFLAVSDVFQVNGGYSPLYDIEKFKALSSNIEYLTKETVILKQKYADDFNKQLFRVCCSPQTAREHSYVPEAVFEKGLEASKDRLMTNRLTESGVYDVNIYESIYNKRNSEFLNAIMEKKSDNLEKLLALLNVRFVASSRSPKAVGFKIANKADAANIYETKSYLPRAFLADNPVVIKDKKEMLERMKNGKFDPEKDVFLEESVIARSEAEGRATKQSPRSKEIASLPSVARNDESVVISSYAPNKIIIAATVANNPKFLVLSDTYYPGWKALVDGKKDRIYRADYILRAVYLNPGSHKVEFIYDPLSFKIGLFITCLTLIILTLIVFNNIIKRNTL